MMILIASVIFGLFGVCIGAAWDYKDVDKWPVACKTGKKQSPIDIKTANVKYDEKLGNITVKGYGKTIKNIKLQNNGHTVKVDLGNAGPFDLKKGGALKGDFNLVQLHFHWGSEHMIDGKRYAAEMHLVHKTTSATDLTGALKKEQGVAVLGYLFEEDKNDNAALNGIINNLDKIKTTGKPVDVVGQLTLSDLMSGSAYYYYPGSLTTPDCNEVVAWIVFSKPIKISKKQLEAFKSLDYTDSTVKKNNFRPAQAIGDRKVTTNVKTSSTTGSSVLFALNYAFFVVSILSISI